tara:strand:- start:3668 stop:3940 length:273 start_codon:yes stop_codon:yes gene_type:complete
MAFSVDYNVALPASRSSNTSSTYPWDNMAAPKTTVDGELELASFFVPVASLPSKEFRPSPPDRLKRTGFKVETRKRIENEIEGVRVFRTA